MEQFIMNLINRYGYLGLFGFIAAEALFPPIPSEIILTAGGFITTCTSMSFWGVTFVSTFASILGALLLYFIGRSVSMDMILKILQGPMGHFLHFPVEDVLRTIECFKKMGAKTVFFCRFVPVLRNLISLPAGIAKMNLFSYLLYTSAGCFLWNFFLIYLGNVLGHHRNYFFSFLFYFFI